MVKLAILADDLTGAADAAGAFAHVGWPTRLVFEAGQGGDALVLVRSTESRDLPAADAAEVNRRAASGLPPGAIVYKKIDSMLRGHPREELRGVMTALGDTRCVVAAALPGEGRTTVGGRQRFAGSPPASIDLAAMFGRGQGLPVTRLDLGEVRRGPEHIARVIAGLEVGPLVVDAETAADLVSIAGGVVASGIRLVAGSAGLARQLALALPGERSASVVAGWKAIGAILVVAASRHAAMAAQVEALGAAGVTVVRPTAAMLDGDETDLDWLVDELARQLAVDRPVVLTTSGHDPSRHGPAFVVRLLAGAVVRLAERELVGGLVLTGGDVAAGVVAALGAREIVLGGEVRPAIPWGVLHSALLPPVPVVTKAGSFGERDALVECLRWIGGRK